MTCFPTRPSLLLVLAGLFLVNQLAANQALGQTGPASGGAGGSVGGGTLVPFVIAVIPIVGPNGVVGGISIDAEGVVSRAKIDTSRKLARERAQAIGQVTADAQHSNQLRKISLRKLEQELIRLETAKQPLTGEVKFLAGLQRIEYVFVDPTNNDIILAGPAEGWGVDPNGFVVGVSSGRPVVELGDLLIALRSERDESLRGITCSMDATQEGLKNYSDYIQTAKPQLNETTFNNMLQAIGSFEVTFTGIPTNSHYARVLISADLLMKRLALKLEPSPIHEVTSYIEMLQKSRMRIKKNNMPRWWLADDYETLLRDDAGLAWKISGPAVKAMTNEDFLSLDGKKTNLGKANPLAKKWADNFSEQYQTLSVEMPVFGQVRNCMDLAVVGALLTKYELFEQAGFQSSVLLQPDTFRLAKYEIPRYTPPQISYAPHGRHWIVTLSGGIDIDGWSVASNTQVDASLETLRQKVVDSANAHWWWD